MSSAKQLVYTDIRYSGLNLNKPGSNRQLRSSHLADPLPLMKYVCVRVIVVLHLKICYFNIAFNFLFVFFNKLVNFSVVFIL